MAENSLGQQKMLVLTLTAKTAVPQAGVWVGVGGRKFHSPFSLSRLHGAVGD